MNKTGSHGSFLHTVMSTVTKVHACISVSENAKGAGRLLLDNEFDNRITASLLRIT